MALVITPADFEIRSQNVIPLEGTAGETLTCVDPVYLDSSDGELKTGSNAAEATANIVGLVVSIKGTDGNPVHYINADDTTFIPGATLVAGEVYVLGASGDIELLSDMSSGEYITYLFRAISTTEAKLFIKPTGVTKA